MNHRYIKTIISYLFMATAIRIGGEVIQGFGGSPIVLLPNHQGNDKMQKHIDYTLRKAGNNNNNESKTRNLPPFQVSNTVTKSGSKITVSPSIGFGKGVSVNIPLPSISTK